MQKLPITLAVILYCFSFPLKPEREQLQSCTYCSRCRCTVNLNGGITMFPADFLTPFLDFAFSITIEYYGDVFWARAEITPRLLPVIVRANLEIFAVYVYLGLFFHESSNGFNQHWISSVILLPSHQCKTPVSPLDPHLTMLNNFLSSAGFATSLFIFFPDHQQTCRTAQDPCVMSLISSLH